VSQFKTSKEYFAAMDCFVIYIEDEVNPARAAAGLPTIKAADARECFRIMDGFLDRWQSNAVTVADAP
jgi:hypothetical protein